jgi:hypothetical protein
MFPFCVSYKGEHNTKTDLHPFSVAPYGKLGGVVVSLVTPCIDADFSCTEYMINIPASASIEACGCPLLHSKGCISVVKLILVEMHHKNIYLQCSLLIFPFENVQ